MYVVIFITASNLEEAGKISEKLVAQKLVACVNIVSNVKSIFFWEGKVDRANEVLMIVKSRKSLFKKVVKIVKANHSYSVPEIIALPIVMGEENYLSWIKKTTS